jgi:hypothetical protein
VADDVRVALRDLEHDTHTREENAEGLPGLDGPTVDEIDDLVGSTRPVGSPRPALPGASAGRPAGSPRTASAELAWTHGPSAELLSALRQGATAKQRSRSRLSGSDRRPAKWRWRPHS